ncbi:hypothetical protein BCR33DRAFT_189380 [Rhizoclosmatium globosum]|uniref:Uncharacterized protein n=1 Tax=Rhizoclosmatium globosum TaxID=329046 RepID=A0A1Y2D206_9FUNG|nr:hypothetical protein BCR33DRAFT_189380 [Rhizoclosmatium globosum]|eukprot:ORY53164.1 hypothetical protein BCR33DRAFT_189380 [Rhizoclosmatium globosum]
MSHRPDCLYEADFYGNNVLHIMAYYGIFNDVFQLICERNQTDLETLSPKAYNLLQHKNIYGQTPCQLGLSCGHPSTLKALKRIQWKFGVEFVQYCVVLNEICPVLFEKGSSQDSPVVENTTGQIVQPKSSLSAKDTDISKPILVYVVDDLIPNERTFKIIDHSILKSVIYVKWSLYARRYYLWKWFLSSIMVGSFTLAILTASNDKSNTNLSQLVLAAITAAFALQGLNDLVKRINSLYSNEIELRKRANNAKNLLIKYSDPSESGTLESGTLESGTSESKISDSETISWIDSGKILWKILQTDLDEDIVLVTFYITAISAFILILMGKYKPGVNDWLCWAHAWGLLFGWLHFLYYLQGMRGVGPLIYVLRKQIRRFGISV